MKQFMIILFAILLIPALYAQETSVTLPSDATIILNNALPETVRDVFTVETLAERFGDSFPFSVWAMVGLQDDSKVMLIAKILQYDPALDSGISTSTDLPIKSGRINIYHPLQNPVRLVSS